MSPGRADGTAQQQQGPSADGAVPAAMAGAAQQPSPQKGGRPRFELSMKLAGLHW